MFKKYKLKKAIKASKAKIAKIEQRRSRSQASLVEAILTHSTPNDSDVDYFNMFTEQINKERDNLHNLMRQLDEE